MCSRTRIWWRRCWWGGSGGGGNSGSSGDPAWPSKKLPHGNDCSTFENRADAVLNAEGPYTDDPDDSGGPTNRGISWDTWTTFALSMLGVEPTLDNLKKLTKEQALIIYKNQYWDRIKADQIEDGDLRYLLFDFNVTSGSISVKVLQRTINSLGGSIAIDGVIGNKTLALINSINSIDLYNKFKLNRQLFYSELVIRRPKDTKYIDGWTNRVNKFKNKTISKPKNVNCK